MSLARVLLAYVAALLLLGMTLAISISPLPWRPVWIYACAAVEAALILGCFVELQRSSPLVRVFALGALFWFVILFGVGLMDLTQRLQGG